MVDVSITAENVTHLRSLKRGDHLAVEGEMAGVKYYHHGIFLEHKIGVADFGGTNKDTATVRVVDILEFTDQGRRKLVRYLYLSSECLPDEEVAENAEALAANPSLWESFDLMENNCEHFATRCKVGRPVSYQVLQKLVQIIPYVCSAAIGSAISPVTTLSAGASLLIKAATCIYLANKAGK